MSTRHQPLTPREQEILFAYADGRTTDEIAVELQLSPQTIKHYSKHLLVKMGARNRTHAVALAYHRGLLVPLQNAP
jgi:DNA-binding NarL/FixJ family response regulator